MNIKPLWTTNRKWLTPLLPKPTTHHARLFDLDHFELDHFELIRFVRNVAFKQFLYYMDIENNLLIYEYLNEFLIVYSISYS